MARNLLTSLAMKNVRNLPQREAPLRVAKIHFLFDHRKMEQDGFNLAKKTELNRRLHDVRLQTAFKTQFMRAHYKTSSAVDAEREFKRLLRLMIAQDPVILKYLKCLELRVLFAELACWNLVADPVKEMRNEIAGRKNEPAVSLVAQKALHSSNRIIRRRADVHYLTAPNTKPSSQTLKEVYDELD